MSIRFQFDLDKAVEAMAYIVERLGTVEKAVLMKLLYLADREHFLRYGFPITGDRPYAMKWGPVPSASLDAINGNLFEALEVVFRYLHVDECRVLLRQRPPYSHLTAREAETIDQVLNHHGQKGWALVRETHTYPEYREVYCEGASTPIPYELILRYHGTQEHFRHDRPVVSEAMAGHMLNPLPPCDEDL